MRTIAVDLKDRSYKICIGRDILRRSGKYITDLKSGAYGIIVTNPAIKSLYAGVIEKSLNEHDIDTRILTVPDSESSKSYKISQGLIEKIAVLDKGRKPFVIALGGGVIGDLAGFVAAIYRRGVPLVQIPTTLVAQVDAAIGGKVAIDLPRAKNLVGVFFQPRLIISDASALATLPKREIKCGLSEIIKYAVIDGSPFFDLVRKKIPSILRSANAVSGAVIAKCASIKARIVGKDEKDTKGVRALLNFGHTIGHAVEAASGYRGSYTHGEAVAVGMLAESRISHAMGLLPEQDLAQIESLITRAGLPKAAPKITPASVLNALDHDKKFSGGIKRFALPVTIGNVKVTENVPDNLIGKAAEEVSNHDT